MTNGTHLEFLLFLLVLSFLAPLSASEFASFPFALLHATLQLRFCCRGGGPTKENMTTRKTHACERKTRRAKPRVWPDVGLAWTWSTCSKYCKTISWEKSCSSRSCVVPCVRCEKSGSCRFSQIWRAWALAMQK